MEEPIIKIRDVVVVRGQKVVTAASAAVFYGVAPAVLMRAVCRKRKSFPKDLMFYLTRKEAAVLPGGVREGKKGTLVFTESGVAMLAAVLPSPKAVQTNIEIVRQTVRLLKLDQGV